jgi:3-phosphoshikimate 1-carboxyvinyltransferase
VTSWAAPTAAEPVDAVVDVPGSKSMTNRALVLAALSDGPSHIRGGLDARDTRLMRDALSALGSGVEETPDGWSVTPGSTTQDTTVHCGLAGTVMRFVPPVAALRVGRTAFVGDDAATHRPVGPVLDALTALGVEVERNDAGTLPFSVRGAGQVPGGPVSIDASASSQFVSALLLAGARFEHGLTLHSSGPRTPNRPHIDLTRHMLARHGVVVESTDAGTDNWSIAPGRLTAHDWTIEPDLSNATPFFAAAVLTAGTVRVEGLGGTSVQPVQRVAQLFSALGADVAVDAGGMSVRGHGHVDGIDVDLADLGELTPTVVALALLADGPSRLTGIGYLRGHETDRLAALADDAARLGGRVDVLDDGLVVRPRPLHAQVWKAYADHRMATAGAILGLVVPGVEIDDIGSTTKTLPDFTSLWHRMLSLAS